MNREFKFEEPESTEFRDTVIALITCAGWLAFGFGMTILAMRGV